MSTGAPVVYSQDPTPSDATGEGWNASVASRVPSPRQTRPVRGVTFSVDLYTRIPTSSSAESSPKSVPTSPAPGSTRGVPVGVPAVGQAVYGVPATQSRLP